jgi:hypothetical protein
MLRTCVILNGTSSTHITLHLYTFANLVLPMLMGRVQ